MAGRFVDGGIGKAGEDGALSDNGAGVDHRASVNQLTVFAPVPVLDWMYSQNNDNTPDER
ncbi:hypothetical protein RE428_39150 [Marinobacter nanhaiticus D15-8W]|nr:hypothetical protein RE428_39150 [Marinobacter nanhaiticus D15-8W]